jgi:hypothetical protein
VERVQVWIREDGILDAGRTIYTRFDIALMQLWGLLLDAGFYQYRLQRE